ncbi:hypothetical protein SmJEL517_g00655 [Synchytrium microbalum]|uniref:AMP-dependent synthetase/ligase domain-containing protein n=1 Tax=Synchytrium microbalum TaxID=1806994 RepID=A0A507CE22_9FUNG|nr:uncharacterized protein SmJEL517_g00655 [Synchytrium microbalum]TPX37598.1 hypothetical protein SmJEL517_g00655 [Synchytrium microbalum]
MATNLNDVLQYSNAPALVIPKAYSPTQDALRLSYSHLRSAISQLSNQSPFTHLTQGDRVAFLIPNGLEFVVTFFAITATRAAAAPLNPGYTGDEIKFYFEDIQPKFVIVLRGYENVERVVRTANDMHVPVMEVWAEIKGGLPLVNVHWLKPMPNAAIPAFLAQNAPARGVPVGSDTALFLHTSGTTSRPKGVPLSHLNILTSLRNISNTYSLAPTDITYIVMPLFHVHGLLGALFSTLFSGGSAVVPPKFSVTSFWQEFLDHDSTWYSAVPTIHQMLLSRVKDTFPNKTGRLRFIRSCSASLAPATLQQLETVFKVPVVEAYAMTEAAHQMTSNFLPPGLRKPGSVGKGRGVEIVIMDEQGKLVPQGSPGEVCIRGANVITAYHNNPTATATAFHPDPKKVNDSAKKYFRTGDLGYEDESGFVFLVGRSKEQINRGGEKISPLEIDNILLSHPEVNEAVAFPVPSEMYGQEIEAAVVLKSQVTEDALKQFVSSKLSKFKVPKKIHFVTSIPKGPTGKIQRNMLGSLMAKL